MNATHTPGPWSLNLPCLDEVVADFGGNDISIAQAIRNPADARLIVAAPDLLKALKKLCAIQEYGDVASWASEWDEARAAIAKAEGNQ